MSAGIFADEAPRYWAKGLSVVPVRPGTKQPSINKWSSFAANLPKEARRN